MIEKTRPLVRLGRHLYQHPLPVIQSIVNVAQDSKEHEMSMGSRRVGVNAAHQCAETIRPVAGCVLAASGSTDTLIIPRLLHP